MVALEQFWEVVLAHCLDHHVPRHCVNSVVEISVQHANLVVENHAAVAAVDKEVGSRSQTVF